MNNNRDHVRAVLGSLLNHVMTPELLARVEQQLVSTQPDTPFPPERFALGGHDVYVFQVESFADALPELKPLHAAHWQETEKYRQGLVMKPDYQRLVDREAIGGLLQFTVRDGVGGALVGHICMYINRSTHTSQLVASEDTFFILREHRKGWLALKFWQYMEQCLLSIGVTEISTDSKTGEAGVPRDVGVLNRRLGYKPVARRFVKIFPVEVK